MEDFNNNKVINLKPSAGDTDRASHSKFGNYRPDEELLQSTARIKNQRDIILDRMNKMDLAKSRVSKTVYEKVKRDYALQLQTITELLNEKKETLKKEIKELYLRREKLTIEVNRHKEILEEAEFRYFLEEFTQAQYQEVEGYETKEIERLETDLGKISGFVRSHEELFDPQDLGLSPEATRTAVTPPSHKTPTAQTRPMAKQSTRPAPVPAQQNDELISANEFEALFLDDETQENAPAERAGSNINAILNDDAPIDLTQSRTRQEMEKKIGTSKADQTDYFKQGQVNEASFTVKKTVANTEISPDEATPKPVSLQDSDNLGDHTTDVKISSNKVASGDSMSDILGAIAIDSALSATQDKKEIPLDNTAQTIAEGQYILTLVEGELDQKEFAIKENTSIGRSSSNDIVLKAPKVSRQHAAINMYNDQFIVIDLKSSNGVYVNGTKIDECVLNPGDEVSVGGYKFLFAKK